MTAYWQKILLLVVIICLNLPISLLAQEESMAEFKNGIIRAGGSIDISEWPDEAWAIVGNGDSYNRWMIKGMDGGDPISATHWEQFKDWTFTKPDWLFLTFDVNMGWPLGSKNNIAKFKIDSSRYKDGYLDFTLQDAPAVLIKTAKVEIQRTLNQKGRLIVQVDMVLEFSGLVNALLNMDEFLVHIKTLMGIVRANFRALRPVH